MFVCASCGAGEDKMKFVLDAVKVPGLTPNYVGRLVFVEKVRKPEDTAKTYSNYDGGEYFVLRQSTATLYGVKIASPDEYNGRQIKQLALVGEDRYAVLSTDVVGPKDLESFVIQLWYNATKESRGEKLSWVGSVYTEAQATAQSMARMLGITLPPAGVSIETGKPLLDRLKALEAEVLALKTKLRAI